MDVEDALALGNPTAKMLVWNLATACMKTTGHYRGSMTNAERSRPSGFTLETGALRSERQARS